LLVGIIRYEGGGHTIEATIATGKGTKFGTKNKSFESIVAPKIAPRRTGIQY